MIRRQPRIDIGKEAIGLSWLDKAMYIAGYFLGRIVPTIVHPTRAEARKVKLFCLRPYSLQKAPHTKWGNVHWSNLLIRSPTNY